jgi:hypothetical protein
MDGSRFDAWTRRNFGVAAGGALAGLLALAGRHDAEAQVTEPEAKNCRKNGQTCDQTRRGQECCNDNNLCAQIAGEGSNTFCCKQVGGTCRRNSDCCGLNRCGGNGKCRFAK